MTIHVSPNAHLLAVAAAEFIAQDCRHRLGKDQERYCIAFSGGSTPASMFTALAGMNLPWEQIHIFQVDERVAPAGSQERNWTQLLDNLVQRVAIPMSNLHPMPVESSELVAACAQYQAELERVTGGEPLDLIHLGLGDDGHAASLPPGDPILEVADKDVWYVKQYNSLPRMSLTYPALNRARRILWLVSGAGKAEMCERLVAGDQSIPAGRVSAENAELFADQAAGVFYKDKQDLN